MADTPQAGTTSSIEDQIRLREQKAQMLREKGSHPYGNGVAVSHTTGFVRMRHADDDSKRLEEDLERIRLAAKKNNIKWLGNGPPGATPQQEIDQGRRMGPAGNEERVQADRLYTKRKMPY